MIDQITCSLNFLDEFHLLFHMQKEFRRYHIKKVDRRVKHKFGEFLDFRNHILIWKQNYIKNWFPYALWTTHSLSSTKTLKYICVRQPLLYYYCLWNRKFVIIYIILVSNQNMVPEIQKFATFVFHPSITIFDVIPTKFFLQMKEEVKIF